MSDPMIPEVREWMKRTEAEPPDAQQSARQVMARLPEVRQRNRWWPLLMFYRRPETPPTTNDTTEYQPNPIPATSGHTPTVIGRTQSMFSPVKAITVGALVFAIGGAVLIAQPIGRQAGTAPAAERDIASVAPAWVTGELQFAPFCKSPTSEVIGAVHHQWGADCDSQTWTTDDPRLTGEMRAMWNADVYEPGAEVFRGGTGTNISVITSAYHMRNEDGGWSCRSDALAHGYGWYPEPVTGETVTCVGEGGNDGLSAILVLDGPASGPLSISGLIFPGDFPPLPEPPAAE